MGSLIEVIKDDTKRRAVIDDCVILIDQEVADKRGLTGVAIKTAFRVIKGIKPGMIPMSMNALLDDFAVKLDPFWQECQSTGANPRSFFASKDKQIANALLSITDERAEKSKLRVLVKAYKKLRGKAINHISASMPRFADLMVRHAS